MKAAVLFGNEDLRYTDWETPVCGKGQVKVHVRATGICGSDVPRVLHHGAHFYPIVLGHEFSGDVVEVGEGVTRVKPGDTVSGAPLVPCMKCADCQRGDFSLCKHYSFIGSRQQGSFAEYVVLPESNAIPYDPSVPYEQAAMFEPSTVALHGLLHAGFKGGGDVAVLGLGTIGIFTLQWARILGAGRITAFDLDNSRLELARRMGAHETINTLEPDFLEKARALTGGRGFDDVFEAAGSPVTMKMAFQLAGNKARLCFIGTPHTDMTFSPSEWENMNRKEFTLTGSWMSYSAPFPGREWEWTARRFSSGELKFDPSFIFRTYPLKDAAEAFQLYHNPSQVHGKVMLINE